MIERLFTCIFCLLINFGAFSQDTVMEGVDTLCFKEKQPTDAEINERLQLIYKLLDHDEKAAEAWWYGWLGLYGTATVGQGIVASLTKDKSWREDMILGAGTTLLGAAGQLISPVKSRNDTERLDSIDLISKEIRLEKLKEAEENLKFQANRVKSGKSWQTHAISGAVNLSSGMITWIGFKRSIWAGIGNFAFNTVITEFQIWSQPSRAMKYYSQYCNKYGLANDQRPERTKYVWYAYVSPGKISLNIGF